MALSLTCEERAPDRRERGLRPALVKDSSYPGVLPLPSSGRIDSLPLIDRADVSRVDMVRGPELHDVIGHPGPALLCVERRTT